MHFYSHLITILFPFVVVAPESQPEPPPGDLFVVNYQGIQVVTYNQELLIAEA